jgi:pimeloyl-ACP methyl ester carboxylesterase
MIERSLAAIGYGDVMVNGPFEPPPLRNLVGEACHLAERVMLPAALLYVRPLRDRPHPVLVLPGLWSSDRSTAVLRYALAARGYAVQGWGLGRHPMWTDTSWRALAVHLAEIQQCHAEPVSLVGISAGGIVAREFARQRPQLVRQVITIGSPFRFRHGDRNRMSSIIARIDGGAPPSHFERLPREEERPALPMPSTSIYSRGDGLVDWRTCTQEPGHGRDDIEVRGSHLGLAQNAAVVIAVADRLACRPEDWRPFRPPVGAGILFPVPAAASLA